MHKRTVITGASLLATGFMIFAPSGATAAEPTPDGGVTANSIYCDPNAHYNITSRDLNYMKGLSSAVTYKNTTGNQQSFSKAITVSGSVSMTLSTTVGVDQNVALTSIKASVTGSATTTVSGSSTVQANMVVSPYKTGELTAGIGRVKTSGTYAQYYTNCDLKVSKSLTVVAPTGWAFVAREY